jgi:hypothetical protein
MPSPSASLATLRPDLGDSFTEFSLDALSQGFIGTRVARPFETMKQAGSFGKWTVEQLLQEPETARAPGSHYNRITSKFGTATFACVDHGIEEPVDDRAAAMYRDYFDAELVAAARARSIVMRSLEKRLAALLFNATTWTGASLTTAITNEWDDHSNAVPVTDVNAAKQAVFERFGFVAELRDYEPQVFENARLCTQVQNIIRRAVPATGLRRTALPNKCWPTRWVSISCWSAARRKTRRPRVKPRRFRRYGRMNTLWSRASRRPTTRPNRALRVSSIGPRTVHKSAQRWKRTATNPRGRTLSALEWIRTKSSCIPRRRICCRTPRRNLAGRERARAGRRSIWPSAAARYANARRNNDRRIDENRG